MNNQQQWSFFGALAFLIFLFFGGTLLFGALMHGLSDLFWFGWNLWPW